MNTTTTTHPTQQYASPNTLAPTGPTGPSQQQVKPSPSVTTLVPIDIEENCPNGTPRRRNRKPREFGFKALRNHLLAVVARTFLIAFSIAVLVYVSYVHKHWTSERKEARDDENYEGGYVSPSIAIGINVFVIFIIFVGFYGGDTGGAALGLFGDLVVMALCVYAFIDVAPWSFERGKPDSFPNKPDDRPYRDDEAVAAWLCLSVGIAHFMNMVGNCFKACAACCGGGRSG